MTSDLATVLSNQNGDLVGHVSFHRKKIICSSAGARFLHQSLGILMQNQSTKRRILSTLN